MPYVYDGQPLSPHLPLPTIDDVNHPSSILAVWSREDLATIGIEWIEPDVPTLEVLRSRANAAVNAKREAIFSGGYPVAAGPLAGQHLQMRGADDKGNWLIAEKNARAAIAAGAGDAPLVNIRTMENNTVTVTPNETVAVLSALEAWGVAVMARSWALKDQNDAAEDEAGLTTEADLETGWP